MNHAPVYKCPYCETELTATIDTTGETPVGVLPVCTCPAAFAAWETEHRAAIERRKQRRRNERNNMPLHFAGRTTIPRRK